MSEQPQDIPVEGAGRWPIRLQNGRLLYALPWTGVSIADTGNTFTASEWAKRKLARKTANASRRRNRR